MKYIVECEKTIKCIYVVDANNDEQCHEKLNNGQFDKKIEFDSTKDQIGHGWNYGGYYYKKHEKYSGKGEETVICSVYDLCRYLGTEPQRLQRDLFKYTRNGIPIGWDDEKVTLCAYAEGADAEPSHDLLFPFTAKEFNNLLEYVEEESEELWHEWNDDDEEE